jgi:hypothetical protein
LKDRAIGERKKSRSHGRRLAKQQELLPEFFRLYGLTA